MKVTFMLPYLQNTTERIIYCNYFVFSPEGHSENVKSDNPISDNEVAEILYGQYQRELEEAILLNWNDYLQDAEGTLFEI